MVAVLDNEELTYETNYKPTGWVKN